MEEYTVESLNIVGGTMFNDRVEVVISASLVNFNSPSTSLKISPQIYVARIVGIQLCCLSLCLKVLVDDPWGSRFLSWGWKMPLAIRDRFWLYFVEVLT